VRHLYLCLLLLFIPAALADGLPELGDSSQLVLSLQDERRIADEILRDVSTHNAVINDIEVVDYLQNLGQRLAAHGPDPQQHFSFFVVKDESINAFAMPGGVIGVHSGLLLAAGSESELASVVGHEIGHVVQRHIARMISQQKQDAWKSWAAMAFALLAARANPQLAGASMQAAQAGAIQRQLDYTREHEREADRVGLQILYEAGFDVRGMPAFFDKLMKGSRFYEGAAPSFLRTHPLTTERIADVSNRVDQLPYRQIFDSSEFHYARAKLRADMGSPQQAVQWFDTALREKKYVNEAAQHYGLALALLRTNNAQRAQQEVAWLRNHTARHPMLETLAAHVQVAAGRLQEAADIFSEGLKLFPNHRGLIYGYAELLLATGRPDSTIELVESRHVNYPDDPYLYELKSKAYTQQGRNLLRHQAQGEAYFRRYNLPAAVGQMELAIKSGDGDFYQLSIVESRLRHLRQQLEDELKKSGG
jgi:predicted Zn-dependent protease